jgi:hypothetical protein
MGTDPELVVAATHRLLTSWRSPDMATALNTSVATLTASFICHRAATTASGNGRMEMIIIPRTSTRMTRKSLHCIKSEFVGILEMAGFAILPKRLKTELAALLLDGALPIGDLAKFGCWMKALKVDGLNGGARAASARATAVTTTAGTCDDADTTVDRLVASPEVNAALYAAFNGIIEDNSGFPSQDHETAAVWLNGAGITLKSD